jgi:hypothetical protein
MMNNNTAGQCAAGVKTFVRNRYFYGKLLDVLHFELEQDYFNAKRFLINRLVLGYGVVCGLDVEVGSDGLSVVVQPGVAIDKWGREIVVPGKCKPLPLPAPSDTPPTDACDDENCYHLLLCYHECQSDPAPALGGDCDQNAVCSPGAIREKYDLCFVKGKLPDVSMDCSVADLISGSKINYAALANYVSAPCAPCPDDPCIPLANVVVPAKGSTLQAEQIDIAVRPIVYTNDLLHDLLICLTNKSSGQDHYRGGKG